MTLVGESDSGESTGRPEQKAEGEMPASVKATRPLASRQKSKRKEGIKAAAAAARHATFCWSERASASSTPVDVFLCGCRLLPPLCRCVASFAVAKFMVICDRMGKRGRERGRKEAERKEPLLLRGGEKKWMSLGH